MAHSVATFPCAGPESRVFETVDLYGRYNRMWLAERTDHAMLICRDSFWTGRTALRVTTQPQNDRVDVTLEVWVVDRAGGEWNANPKDFYNPIPRSTAWGLALGLARVLGVSQPENLFVHRMW